jgi:hypothetical protein
VTVDYYSVEHATSIVVNFYLFISFRFTPRADLINLQFGCNLRQIAGNFIVYFYWLKCRQPVKRFYNILSVQTFYTVIFHPDIFVRKLQPKLIREIGPRLENFSR